MPPKKKEVKEETVTSLSPEQERDKKNVESASSEIETTLKTYGLALQPVLHYSDYGVIPQVRLVKVPAQESTGEQFQVEETNE